MCGTYHFSFLHRTIMASTEERHREIRLWRESLIHPVRATREEVEAVMTLLATLQAFFSGLRCGCHKSCIDRIFRTFLRQRGSLAVNNLMKVPCTPLVGTCRDQAWRIDLPRTGVLDLRNSVMFYVSDTPIVSRRNYRTLSLGSWYVWQLCVQRTKTTERCLQG